MLKKIDDGIVVMDNAPAHTSKTTLAWISKHFRVLRLPPQSSELNPIETISMDRERNRERNREIFYLLNLF